MKKTIFISGIDTDAGKSYCTGWLAKRLADQGYSVITQKFIQTGNVGFSEDIELHRKITGTGMLPEDRESLTAPIVFSYPASAQLAARIDRREIDLGVIDNAARVLSERYDILLIEGAGGLMVPLTDTFMAIDYVATRKLPIMLVTNSRLGSINHTVLSLEAIKSRGIKLEGVLYNTYFDTTPEIARDTRQFTERYIDREFPGVEILDVPTVEIS